MTPAILESGDFVMNETLNNSVCIPNEKLIIGNHESILLFGSNAQSELRDCSRRITKMIIDSSFDYDITISEVLNELKAFEKISEQTESIRSVIIRQRSEERIIVRYKDVLNYLEKITLFFQLQQAQLIKESALLKQLYSVVQRSVSQLKNCIREADTLISDSSPSNSQNDELFWFERLKKRTEDLKISYTLSLQSQAQLKLLLQNDILLIDKISFIVSNTIPLWQNRMSILLGIKLSEKHLDVQEKVLKATERYLKKPLKKQNHNIDFEETAKINEKLQQALQDIELSEKQDFKVRKDIQELLN